MNKSQLLESVIVGLMSGIPALLNPASLDELGSIASEPLEQNEGCKGKGGCGGKDGCGGKGGCGGKKEKK